MKHPGRVAIVVGVVAVVITLGVWGLSASETDPGVGRDAPTLPAAIETLSPGPGELVRPQDTITIDLRDDLTGVLLLRREQGSTVEIPEDQLERVIPLGQLSFRTGPDQELARFEPGEYTATVYFWPQAKPRPDRPASYSWRFRAGA